METIELKDAIIVTNDPNYVVSNQLVCVPYYLHNATERQLDALHRILVKHWKKQAIELENRVIGGMIRGKLEIDNGDSINSLLPLFSSSNRPTYDEIDLLHTKGLNPIIFFPGRGLIIWGIQVWHCGNLMDIFNINDMGYRDGAACVPYLNKLGVKFGNPVQLGMFD